MTGVEMIAAERQRQIEEEGWTEEHDAQYTWGTLATAGAVYALPGPIREQRILDRSLRRILWPFGEEWWKPSDMGEEPAIRRVRELVKAGALIAAEIDKITKEAWRP